MSIYEEDLRPLSLQGVNTYPLASRESKVSTEDFARPVEADPPEQERTAFVAVERVRIEPQPDPGSDHIVSSPYHR